ncbi:RNA dependent RNA polymerase [Sporobolomyces koalae]|uniref:RNA dependent RNA polymerase n=1 Tax=Sporobolomyces koalae TaxID=500713 RepID=UPI003175DC16
MRQPRGRDTSYASRGCGPARTAQESFSFCSIAFGTWLTPTAFSVEWQRLAGEKDELKFPDVMRNRKGSLTVRIWDKDRHSIRISVELDTIDRIQRSSGGKVFYLDLRVPPRFEKFAQPQNHGQDRLPLQVCAFDQEHGKVAPYVSRSLRLEVRDYRDAPLFLVLAAAHALPRVISSRILTIFGKRCSDELMDTLLDWIGKLDIPVGFQLEKLFRNGLIDPVKLVKLKTGIDKLLRTEDSATVERILAFFADGLTLLDEFRARKPTTILLSDNLEEEMQNQSPTPEKQKKRAHSDEGIDVIDLTGLPDSESDEDSLMNRNLSLPTSMRSKRSTASPNPRTLSVTELVDLLDYATTNSNAGFYKNVDPASLSRQVTITPTGLVLSGPSLAESNSILRRYGHPDHFLRVVIRNDDGTLLQAKRPGAMALIESRFKQIFHDGLVSFLGTDWCFLAWTAAGLKSGSCFFVAPFVHDGEIITPELIHRDIGDFLGDVTARIPAKYMARISQAFTSSKPSLELLPGQVIKIPDIVSTNGSLFSDGCGLISRALAAEVISLLGLKPKDNKARTTCFQVRIGGAKGMLQIDPALDGRKIALRPSQIKFRSAQQSLEIADTFTIARTGFLNRPLVKLLEDLGVPASAFLRLQKTATKKIRHARSKLTSAVTLLEHWGLARSSQLSRVLSYLAKDRATGALLFKNAFVAQCLDASLAHILRDVKHKARIPLDGCYNLVGVVDVSGTLEEGTIYARIQHPDGGFECLQGTIAISRSPTNHPGDVQIVSAVGHLPRGASDRIRHLVNCVVFSAKGERSLPSMLAGGDLDGDLYLLLTEASGLVPQPEQIAQPAAYQPSATTQLDRDATIADGIDFFFEYLQHDLTTLVASRQLSLADWYREGLFHRDCLELAQLHSDCVDYVKSGTPVRRDKIPPIPREMRDKGGQPDYNSTDPQAYTSRKALGQLFRALDLDSEGPPELNVASVDPLRCLTASLLLLDHPGLDGNRLPAEPPRCLVEAFKRDLDLFSFELGKIASLYSPPAKEEELFMGVLIRKLNPNDKIITSLVVERTKELFSLVRQEISGPATGSTQQRVVRAWSAWIAAIETDEELAETRRNHEGRFGARSWAFLALAVLTSELHALEREQVDCIVID